MQSSREFHIPSTHSIKIAVQCSVRRVASRSRADQRENFLLFGKAPVFGVSIFDLRSAKGRKYRVNTALCVVFHRNKNNNTLTLCRYANIGDISGRRRQHFSSFPFSFLFFFIFKAFFGVSSIFGTSER